MHHVALTGPRRGEWWTTWRGLPGLTQIVRGDGLVYTHELLDGWEYRTEEFCTEMIPDLEALAEHGVRPTVATRRARA